MIGESVQTGTRTYFQLKRDWYQGDEDLSYLSGHPLSDLVAQSCVRLRRSRVVSPHRRSQLVCSLLWMQQMDKQLHRQRQLSREHQQTDI
jgi:hypothetical protein